MSDLKQTIGFLQNVPLFHSLNNRQLELLAKRMVEREYASAQAIVTQDKAGEGFFIIVSGKAEALRQRSDGARHRRRRRAPGAARARGAAALGADRDRLQRTFPAAVPTFQRQHTAHPSPPKNKRPPAFPPEASSARLSARRAGAPGGC